MQQRTKVHIFKLMPATFVVAYRASSWPWVIYHKQYLTPDDVRELRTLWRLTSDVALVCQRLHDLAPNSVQRVTWATTTTTGGHTDGE